MKEQLSSGRQEKNGRKTENTLYSIQAYRGIAALLVVLFHANTVVGNMYGILPFHGFFSFGFSGVHLLISIFVGIFFYKKIERPLLLFLRGKVASLG